MKPVRRTALVLALVVYWPRVLDGWKESRTLQIRRELREMIARCDALLDMPWYAIRRPW